MTEISYYDQRTKNLHVKFALSPQAKKLLKIVDDVQVGRVDDSELGRMIRQSPAYRHVISETISSIAISIAQNPQDAEAGATLIRLLTKILQIADTNAETMLPFMKFPPEIRGMIYRHYLPKAGFYGKTKAMYPADKKTNCACSHEVPNSWQRKTWKSDELALALVSSTVRQEFMTAFYRDRLFFFNCTCEMEHYLSTNDALRRNVGSIKFHWCGPRAVTAFKLLKRCLNLTSLTVMPSMATTRWLTKRQQFFGKFFTQSGVRARLTDALGIDELVELRGYSKVSAVHCGTRVSFRRTNEELANLHALLNSALKQDKEVRCSLRRRSAHSPICQRPSHHLF
ncbi:hypothetical protein RB601_003334, partial [Gaeumannomyces tritici]